MFLFSRDAAEETFHEDAQLFSGAEGDFGGEDVVLFFGDLFEQAAIDG